VPDERLELSMPEDEGFTGPLKHPLLSGGVSDGYADPDNTGTLLPPFNCPENILMLYPAVPEAPDRIAFAISTPMTDDAPWFCFHLSPEGDRRDHLRANTED